MMVYDSLSVSPNETMDGAWENETIPASGGNGSSTDGAYSCSSPGIEDAAFLLRSRVTFIVVYSILIVVAVAGNSAIALVILTRGKLRSKPINMFIANLAISDIVQCLFNHPLQLYYALLGNWTLGSTLCKLLFSTFGIPTYLSAIMMLLIAVDRYILIVHPHKRPISTNQAGALISMSILVSATLASPLVYYSKMVVAVDIPECGLYYAFCTETWATEGRKLIYSVVTAVLQFFGPLTVTAVLYGCIAVSLHRRPATGTGGTALANATTVCVGNGGVRAATANVGAATLAQRRRTQRTITILICTVIVFVVCWLPLQIFSLLLDFAWAKVIRKATIKVLISNARVMDLVLKAVSLTSTCLNPVLYGFLNKGLRTELRQAARASGRPTAAAVTGRLTRLLRVGSPLTDRPLRQVRRGSEPTPEPRESFGRNATLCHPLQLYHVHTASAALPSLNVTGASAGRVVANDNLAARSSVQESVREGNQDATEDDHACERDNMLGAGLKTW